MYAVLWVVHICHNTSVEVRRQLAGLADLLPQRLNSDCQVSGNWLHSLSILPSHKHAERCESFPSKSCPSENLHLTSSHASMLWRASVECRKNAKCRSPHTSTYPPLQLSISPTLCISFSSLWNHDAIIPFFPIIHLTVKKNKWEDIWKCFMFCQQCPSYTHTSQGPPSMSRDLR